MVMVTGLVTEDSEMEEFKGTPGLWEVAGPCCGAVGTEFDSAWYKAICHRPERTGGKLTDEYNANMHLIAAAPELLEALQEMVAIVKKHSYPTPDKPTSNYSRAEAAEAVIAKALGK